jgi:hypothetical protein
MRLALFSVVALGGIAQAAPHGAPPVMVEPSEVAAAGALPRVLFLDRCANGCTVMNNGNDATTDSSTIPTATAMLSAFAFGDSDWAGVLKCVQDVYSAYDIQVVDVKPDAATLYNKTFVAGLPSQIGQTADVLGIAPLAMNCSVLSNNVAFAFANQHTPTDRVNNICWTVAQESAHMYGLDHEYQFTDGASACNDPMTYRNDCGGEKFFRDRAGQCGENAVRDCKCSRPSQNSDAILLDIFGPGTPTSTPPVVSIVVPAAGGISVTNGFVVQAMAGAQRGVEAVQLVLNGHAWLTAPGTGFGMEGQPTIVYAMQFPPTVPDGVIDIQVRGLDDLGVATLSPVVTVQKGAPCADASMCLTGQTCGSGKCAWAAPTAETGSTCSYNEFCVSNTCINGTCEQPCNPSSTSVRTGCPATTVCGASAGANICMPDTGGGGGCCSSSRGGAAQAALGMFGLAMLLRRRRRC